VNKQHQQPLWKSLVNVLGALLSGDVMVVLRLMTQFLEKFPVTLSPSGLYQVLEHEVRLELKDPLGKEAVYFKRQRVRFLQDNIMAYQDTAWGDGEIFVDYQCSPGVPVDRYRDGHRYRILISLRGTKNRGDLETFHIQRTITDGFIQPLEELQTDLQHQTESVRLTLIFPVQRPPKQVSLLEQDAQRSTVLTHDHLKKLPDDRMSVTWFTDHPRRFEAYTLRWEW
jgi:hypothetical protein